LIAAGLIGGGVATVWVLLRPHAVTPRSARRSSEGIALGTRAA